MSEIKIPMDHPLEFDTPYAHIVVFDRKRKREPIRVYLQSGAYGSASFLREKKRNELVFNYLKAFDSLFSYVDGRKLLLIGGAGYQYPKYIISHYPDKRIDVVEIDPDSLKIAREYFFLNDCLLQYDDPENPRFRSFCDDGRAFMKGCLERRDRTYDIIYNDAFGSYFPAPRLATKEAAGLAMELLNPGGLYVCNTLGAPKGSRGRFLRSEYRTLTQVFPYVYCLPVRSDEKSRDGYSNHVLIASREALDLKGTLPLKPEPDDIVFADNEKPGVHITEMVMGNYYGH